MNHQEQLSLNNALRERDAYFAEAARTKETLAEIIPALDAFAPGLIIISAGFDAHARDPLAQLRVREADFAWLTEQLCAVAERHCGGKVVSLLEGGYDLEALALSTAAHVRALMRA
jgi:acetoin utilization deacetylase AcuC-like enzyme